MRAFTCAIAVLCAALASSPALAVDPDAVISEIQVVGGTTLNAETMEYYLGVSPEDPYDREAVAAGFHRLWESGLVEDATIEAEEVSPGQVRLIVTVKERPKVSEFAFEGNKKLSTSTIKEKLDGLGVVLRRNVPLRTSEVSKLKGSIVEVYSKEGYASAIVDPVVETVGLNLRRVVFKVDEGVKIKIGDINFEGNQVFSDSRLAGSLKKVKEKSLVRMFSKKTVWSQEAWGEDSENLKKYYMNRGYKDIIVGEPQVELVAGNPSGKTQKEKKFRMVVKIPVEEGKQFRMGSLTLKGVTKFQTERLRKAYVVKEGKVYDYAEVEAGNEAVKSIYHGSGYIYAYTNQTWVEHPDVPDLVDVVVNVYEGDRFRLGRLEFVGNNKTQDKVIRREFRLFEGEWMDMNNLKRSLFKVNQLGYFKLKEDPLEFKFDDAKRLVNVTIKGEEVGRTDIQFGAGYSELDGLFGQFMFNTRNFLGRGATLGLSASMGRRADTYTLSYSEPYFLDRRMVIGGSIYNQKYNLDESYSVQQYYRDSIGGSLLWGVGLGVFGQFTTVYGYDDAYAKYTSGRYFAAGDGPDIPHRPPLPPPIEDPRKTEYYFAEYEGVTSSLTPAVTYDSRDDPFDPNRGGSAFGRLRYAGGVLGGDFHYFRPEIGASWFLPVTRRFIAAANMELGLIRPFAGKDIPIYDRYRLGGERSLRGFQYLQVLPRKQNGEYFRDANGIEIGGDRYFQLNMEWQVKLGGPIKFILFADIGNTWVDVQGWDFAHLRYGTGAELRIFLPIFQAPLRFIYGVNMDPFPDEERSDFTFSIGTTF